MLDYVRTLLETSDLFATIEYLALQKNPREVIGTYSQLVLDLYWKQKDLTRMISIAQADIHYGLMAAGAATDPTAADDIRGTAGTIAYNLASFAWAGWDEPGITVTSTAHAIGLDAARTNLRLTKELRRDDLALSRASWMIGAHLIAAAEYRAAQSAFEQAAHHANVAGGKTDVLLAKAFYALVDVLQGRDDAELEALKAALAQEEDGEVFAGQVDSARRVFSRQIEPG